MMRQPTAAVLPAPHGDRRIGMDQCQSYQGLLGSAGHREGNTYVSSLRERAQALETGRGRPLQGPSYLAARPSRVRSDEGGLAVHDHLGRIRASAQGLGISPLAFAIGRAAEGIGPAEAVPIIDVEG